MKVAPIHKTIVSFGCWNQTHTAKGPSLRNETLMEELNKHRKDLVLVSGDNYYPIKMDKKSKTESKEKSKQGEKEKKEKDSIKQVNLDQLKQGFKNLKDATEDCEVFMNFGNHDVVSNDQVNVKEEDLVKGECVIMKTELEEGNDNFHVGMSHKILYGDHTLILMIDTSIYAPAKEFKKYAPCYNELKGKDQRTLVVEQGLFIKRAVKEFQGQNIIIVGHYPLFYEKVKKKNRIYVTENSEDFIKILFDINDGRNMYYLCADYHVYEEGIVTIIKDGVEKKIHQYIVGTGGTELDPFTRKEKMITTASDEPHNYELQYQINKTKIWYGFLKGKYTKNGWIFSFVSSKLDSINKRQYKSMSKLSKISKLSRINENGNEGTHPIQRVRTIKNINRTKSRFNKSKDYRSFRRSRK
jgi:hypothetical protein